ncbi:unnamed protein product [Paramecium pentaurelia]|uniref:Uncharacterized protein n=1 Tax=Paramecium pentaurelia TaxID=43138 RepID=A0A8S1TB27_9CILI|nr:unnamed protein product [Paramecium pentaurelia]
MIKIKPNGELLNYQFLQVPQCNFCSTYISNLSIIKKDQWQCQICKRLLKLPVWYKQQPILYDNFEIALTQPSFNRRALFLIDVTSQVLCRMIIPLIEQSLNQFDEIALIPCTPYPTILQFVNNKIRMITLTSQDQECKLDLFLNCSTEFQKIRQLCRIIESLSQYNQNANVLKSNYPIELAQSFINRLLEYQSIKIIHFTWINQFIKPEIKSQTDIKIGKNHYHLFIIQQSCNVQDYYNEISRNLHGKCNVYNDDDLDTFYNEVDAFFQSSFCWEAQIQINLPQGWKIQKFQNLNTDSNQFYLPYLTNQDEIQIEFIQEVKQKPKDNLVQTIISYKSKTQKHICVANENILE